ncbi:hypothetical protein B0J13DRAFT_565226 [Dactylonectria estremocensis]|uniref:Uncharacterized protein n=1 Tax=Dactylonectria estremocensis TaxID=1079267 RepID=A0A9P9IN03_9HYPO|nr:hypothetical protein B0J13DRAFT_565226 [Dactylonectria estremocensis]
MASISRASETAVMVGVIHLSAVRARPLGPGVCRPPQPEMGCKSMRCDRRERRRRERRIGTWTASSISHTTHPQLEPNPLPRQGALTSRPGRASGHWPSLGRLIPKGIPSYVVGSSSNRPPNSLDLLRNDDSDSGARCALLPPPRVGIIQELSP